MDIQPAYAYSSAPNPNDLCRWSTDPNDICSAHDWRYHHCVNNTNPQTNCRKPSTGTNE